MRNIFKENSNYKTAAQGMAHSLKSWEIKRLMDRMDRMHADIREAYGSARPSNLYFKISLYL